MLLLYIDNTSAEKCIFPSEIVQSWLCKHGIPSFRATPETNVSRQLTPLVPEVPASGLEDLLARFDNKGIYQGPFDAKDLEALGLTGSTYTAQSMAIDSVPHASDSRRSPWDGNKLFGYTRERNKYPEMMQGQCICEQPDVPAHFVFQSLKAPKGWREVAWVTEYEDGAGVTYHDVGIPIAISKGGMLLLGAPLIYLASHKHWVPTSGHSLGYPERLTMNWPTEKWLVRQMEQVALDSGSPFLQIAPWPYGKKSAFTIRHDYDRPISKESLEELLALYKQKGFKSSWGFKPSLLPHETIQRILEEGHEVVLHTEAAPASGGLAEEINKLQAINGVKLSGMTAHGGVDAVGFQGADQVIAAEEAGLLYFETATRDNFYPHEILVCENGSVRTSSVMAPALHFSLDTGTNPETHRGEELFAQMPTALMEGGQITLMNHPDINRKAFFSILEDLPLAASWHATHDDILGQFQSVMYGHELDCTDGIQIVFKSPRKHPATMTLKMAGQLERTFTVPAGESSVEIVLGEKTSSKGTFSNDRQERQLRTAALALTSQAARDLALEAFSAPDRPERTTCRLFSESMLEAAIPRAGYDASSIYYLDTEDKFDHLANSVPLFNSPWGECYASWLTHFLKPGGTLSLKFTKDCEKRGFLYPQKVEELYGVQGNETASGQLVEFRPDKVVQSSPSVLDWFMRHKHKAVLDDLRKKYAGVKDPRLADPLYAEFIEEQKQIDSFLNSQDGIRPYFGLGDPGPITNVEKEIEDILRMYSYYVGGIRYKGAVVAHIIEELLGNKEISVTDIGGGMGLLAVELLLDRRLNVTNATVRDLNYFAYIQAGNLYTYFRDNLLGKFHFSLGSAHTYSSPSKNDVAIMTGSLLYLSKEHRLIALQKAWDSLSSGGLLIVQENIKSPNYVKDYRLMFTSKEIDGLLSRFGRVRHYFPNALLPATPAEAERTSVFRVVQKR